MSNQSRTKVIATLAPVATVALRSSPTPSTLQNASVGQQWPHSASATMALAYKAEPPADGSSPRNLCAIGLREQPRD